MAAGLELSWEPWDWGRRRDTVNEKTVAVEQSKLTCTRRRTTCWWMWTNNSAGCRKRAWPSTWPSAASWLARTKLQEVTEKYGQKTALLRDVLQQQAAVEKANSDYNEAIAAFWTAKANFDKSIGED